MRFLFASTKGAGHFAPLVPVIDACLRAGHDVLVVAPPALGPTLEAAGYPFRLGADPDPVSVEALRERIRYVTDGGGGGDERLALERSFGDLRMEAMVPTVRLAIEKWRPELVLRDPLAFASAGVAHELGVPHARVAFGLASFEELGLEARSDALEARWPGLVGAIRSSPYLTRFPQSLDPPSFARTLRAGPHVRDAPTALPDWWDGSDAPLVYVSFGRLVGGLDELSSVYGRVLQALAGCRARVLLTVGHGFDPDELGSVPANAHVEQWVPQAEVLPHASVVVCHGGSGTMLGALAHGVPLVVVPLFGDQPRNAARVEAVGAGIVVEPDEVSHGLGSLSPEGALRIRAAVEHVRSDGTFRAAAARVAAEMRQLPPVDDVLDALLA